MRDFIRIFEVKRSSKIGFFCLMVVILCTWWSLYQSGRIGGFGERGYPASVLGHFFGYQILTGTSLFTFYKNIYLVSSMFWLLRVLTPYTSWIAAVSLMLANSFMFENIVAANDHSRQMMTQFIWIFAFWFQFARNKNEHGSFELPEWVIELAVWYICIIHFYAGMGKLIESGFGWANGTNLQLIVYNSVGRDTLLGSFLVKNRWFAQCSQVAVLALEVGAILAIPFHRLRLFLAMGLAGFYLGIIYLLGYQGFVGNLVLSVLFLVCSKRSV